MILIRFTSGLGNQMFQYAFYTYIRKKYPRERVRADLSWFTWNRAHQGFELRKLFLRKDNPAFQLEEAALPEIYRCSGLLPQKNEFLRFLNRGTRLVAGKYFSSIHYSETGQETENVLRETADHLKAGKDAYFTGYFLKECWYRDNLSELKRALSFDFSGLDPENEELLREIEGSESVSIHVRRGDYLNPGYTENFINLPMEYYEKAVELVREKTKNPVFYLFSDDKDYIQEAFRWLPDCRVVTGNSGERSWLDMALMSRCRHNITANSTFSEWAGLLNPHEDALVVYPKAYLKNKDSDIKTIPGWVRL